MNGWTRNKNKSFSALFDTFCFEIDILNWILSSIPSKCASFSGLSVFVPKHKPKSPEVLDTYLNWQVKPLDDELSSDPFTCDKSIDDHFTFLLEYRNQVKATCHINTNSAFPQRRILLCGVKGTLEGKL